MDAERLDRRCLLKTACVTPDKTQENLSTCAFIGDCPVQSLCVSVPLFALLMFEISNAILEQNKINSHNGKKTIKNNSVLLRS